MKKETKRLSGKPADKKGKYVRMSPAAYDKVKRLATKERRTFIAQLDIIVGV